MNSIIDESLLKANRALRQLNEQGIYSDGIYDEENLSSDGFYGDETDVFAETLEERKLPLINNN